MDSCEYQRGIQDRNTKDSIEESIAFINENFDKDIDVLKISDANTVGLTGAHKEDERSRFLILFLQKDLRLMRVLVVVLWRRKECSICYVNY